jgi:hypothetical protein
MSPGDSTSYWDFAEHYHDELEGFEAAMALLIDGQPIYFTTWEGRWINNASPEATWFWKATSPEDFNHMEAMIKDQLCYLRQLLSGLQAARKRL